MQPVTADLEALDGRCIPYRSSRPGERTQALVWVAKELSDLFPTLPLVRWAVAFQGFKPDLWEVCGGVRLSPEVLAPFTDYLANLSLVPGPGATVCPCAYYLARYMANFGPEAACVLAEPEASRLLARYPRLRLLLERMSDGNHVANRVLRRMNDEQQQGDTDPPVAETAG